MARRTGSADLPLHGGRVPPWLAARLASLGAIVCQAIIGRPSERVHRAPLENQNPTPNPEFTSNISTR